MSDKKDNGENERDDHDQTGHDHSSESRGEVSNDRDSNHDSQRSSKANNDDDKHDGRGHGDGDHNDDGHTDNGKGGHGHTGNVAAVALGTELLIDGSFEQSSAKANSWTHEKKVGGWTSDTQVETWGENFYNIKATDGTKIAELDYDTGKSNIFQDVKTEAGAEYTFGFDYMKRPDSKSGSDTIEVYWNGKLVGTVDPTKAAWEHAEFKVTGTGGSDRIEFRESAADNDSYGGLLDNASLKKAGPSATEKAAAEAVAKAAAEKAAAELAAKEAAEKAAAEAAAKEAAEKAAAELAAKEAAEKAAAEAAAKEAAEKAAAELAAKEAEEKAAAEAAANAPKIQLTAEDANDVITSETISGSDENDIFQGGKGNDVISGGKGNDNIIGDETNAVTVGLNINASLGGKDVDPSAVMVTISGMPAGATLSAGVQNKDGSWSLTAEELKGLTMTSTDEGDFKLDVSATSTDGTNLTAKTTINVTFQHGADDELVGNSGNDNMFGNGGDDVMFGGSKPTGTSNPNPPKAADNDHMAGGDGSDVMYGNHGDDIMSGDAGNDWMSGGKGDDVIFGGAGDNTLFGNTGNDVFVAGGGNDKIVGGAGFDTIDFSESASGVTVDLHGKSFSGYGNGTLDGVENVIGSMADDVFVANGKSNFLAGNGGNDTYAWFWGDAKQGADIVSDFNAGDVLDLSKVLKGNAASLAVKADADGTHVFAYMNKSWHEVVTLEGYQGNADDMLKAGMILVG